MSTRRVPPFTWRVVIGNMMVYGFCRSNPGSGAGFRKCFAKRLEKSIPLERFARSFQKWRSPPRVSTSFPKMVRKAVQKLDPSRGRAPFL